MARLRDNSIVSCDGESYVVALQVGKTSVHWLLLCLGQRSHTVKLKKRKRREQGMTLTVGVILIRSSCLLPPSTPSYVSCNLPAMVVMILDPTGAQLPEVG